MVDAATEQQIIHSLEINPRISLEGHLNGVDCLKFNPATKTQLISGSFDKTFRSWDLNAGKCLKEVKAHDAGVWALDFSKDGKNLVTASADKTIKIWDANSYKELATLKGHTYHVYSVNYSPDNTKLVSAGEDGSVKIWELKKNSIVKSIDSGSRIALSSHFSQDGKYLFVANSEGEVIVYETANYTEITRTPKIDGVRAFSIAFDFSSQKSFSKSVFVAYEDHKVRRWRFDGNKLELEAEFKAHLDHCKHVSLHSNLGYLSTCGRDGSAKVWDTDNDKLLFNLVGASDAVTQASFAQDTAHTIAVSSYDQRIRVYQLPNFNI